MSEWLSLSNIHEQLLEWFLAFPQKICRPKESEETFLWLKEIKRKGKTYSNTDNQRETIDPNKREKC